MNCNRIKLFFLIALGCISWVPLQALTSDQLAQVQSQKRCETVIFESYIDPARTEAILLLGGQFDRYLTDDLYVGGTISGAFSGGVGGYGLAALSVGRLFFLTPDLCFDARLNVGAAGGGGVQAGGGLMSQLLFGLRFQPVRGVELKAQAGFIRFLTSGYQPGSLSTGISFEFNHLFMGAS